MSVRMACCALAWRAAALAAGSGPGDLQPAKVGIVMVWERPPSGLLVKALQREVEQVFRPSGLVLTWEDGRQPTRAAYDRVIVVQMRGKCSWERVRDFRSDDALNGARLGWTFLTDGEVIPHSAVDCDQAARAVAAAPSRPFQQQPAVSLFTRLAARVLVHEMLHVLFRSQEHDPAGLCRPSLRVEELPQAMRLRPEQIAELRRLGRRPALSLARGTDRRQ